MSGIIQSLAAHFLPAADLQTVTSIRGGSAPYSYRNTSRFNDSSIQAGNEWYVLDKNFAGTWALRHVQSCSQWDKNHTVVVKTGMGIEEAVALLREKSNELSKKVMQAQREGGNTLYSEDFLARDSLRAVERALLRGPSLAR